MKMIQMIQSMLQRLMGMDGNTQAGAMSLPSMMIPRPDLRAAPKPVRLPFEAPDSYWEDRWSC